MVLFEAVRQPDHRIVTAIENGFWDENTDVPFLSSVPNVT
jgi:hypothetical protein